MTIRAKKSVILQLAEIGMLISLNDILSKVENVTISYGKSVTL